MKCPISKNGQFTWPLCTMRKIMKLDAFIHSQPIFDIPYSFFMKYWQILILSINPQFESGNVTRRGNVSYIKERLQVTSSNDASGNFCAHDINSLHELCYIFTKIKLPTEKSLKYVAITLIFASHPNSELFSQTK